MKLLISAIMTILLLMVLVSCKTTRNIVNEKGVCPPVDAIYLMPEGGKTVLPKGYFDYKQEDGTNLWVPLDKYLKEFRTKERRKDGT